MNEFLEVSQSNTFYETISSLGTILTFGIVAFKFHLSSLSWAFGMSGISLAFLSYYTLVRKKECNKKLSPVVMEQSSSRLDENNYRILVPISNIETAEELIDFATRAALVRNADLLLVHAITKCKQSSDTIEQQDLKHHESIIEKSMERAAERGVKTSSIIKFAQKPSKVIIDSAEEYGVDMIVMGWKGTSSKPHTIISSNVDKVMRDADCDVLVLRGKNFKDIKNIFIPIANPQQDRLKLEVGEIFDTSQDTDIDLYHMISSDLNLNDKGKEERLAELYEGLVKFGQGMYNKQEAQHMINLEVTNRIPHSIISLSSSYDLTIIEAANEGWFQNLVAATRAELIAKRARGKFILLKATTNDSIG